MKGRISNKMGEIQINPDVIALYAGTIAVDVFRYCRNGSCKHERRTCKHFKKGKSEPMVLMWTRG